ncbi:MAG: NAD(P)-dependent glycerol-3-phosphate dehydrogenase [Alphaproteobacteria bacterium]|nr:MAG: NAD(P)-dependent glycerol-3-phosphate dehydrogenase [Alphaproteobacteria bacterium]
MARSDRQDGPSAAGPSAAAPIAVLGAGAFGTAVAVVLARAGREVTLVARDAAAVARIREAGRSPRLPGVPLPEDLAVRERLPATRRHPVVLVAVPTQGLRAALAARAGELAAARALVLLSKGAELGSGRLPTEIAAEVLPDLPAAALTGPGFADEIAVGKPTAMTLAAEDAGLRRFLQELLSTPSLRLYGSADPVGAQVGGALKNVIAIAAGIVIGAGLGESARAALMTRGFAEMRRYAVARGAQPETLTGLSGFGDLALTCTSRRSRNFRFGLALGAGEAPAAGETVEGVATARAIAAAGRAEGIDTPITEVVSAVLDDRMSVAEAMHALLSRPLRDETD